MRDLNIFYDCDEQIVLFQILFLSIYELLNFYFLEMFNQRPCSQAVYTRMYYLRDDSHDEIPVTYWGYH